MVAAEGAIWAGRRASPSVGEPDAFGHRHKANIGEALAAELTRRTGIESLAIELTYDLRSGQPDALDQIVATTFANVAMDLVADGSSAGWSRSGTASTPRRRCPSRASTARRVDVDAMYNLERFRPRYDGRIGGRCCWSASARGRRRRRCRPASALQAGERADRAGDGGHVVVGVALAHEAGLDRLAQRADRQRGAELAGQLEGDPEVLAMERDLEAERVVVRRSSGRCGWSGPTTGRRRRESAATTCSTSRPALSARTMPSATPR